jgi:hypothetical protein
MRGFRGVAGLASEEFHEHEHQRPSAANDQEVTRPERVNAKKLFSQAVDQRSPATLDPSNVDEGHHDEQCEPARDEQELA